jgi:hypothetical protein
VASLLLLRRRLVGSRAAAAVYFMTVVGVLAVVSTWVSGCILAFVGVFAFAIRVPFTWPLVDAAFFRYMREPKYPPMVLGWSDDGWEALRLAVKHPEVERLVLLATPIRDGVEIPDLAAKTLLLFGTEDERTGSRAARWWKRQIPHARFEMCVGQGHDLLPAKWPRVLRHLAPGSSSLGGSDQFDREASLASVL